MIRTILVTGLAVLLLSLAACAHGELKAPCSAGADWWSSSAYAGNDCGPMRSVNKRPDNG